MFGQMRTMHCEFRECRIVCGALVLEIFFFRSRFFLGALTAASGCVLLIAALWLTCTWSCDALRRIRARTERMAEESNVNNYLFDQHHRHFPTVLGATIIFAALCFASSALPPIWTKRIALYWAQNPVNFPRLRSEWLVNDATVPLVEYTLPPNSSPLLVALGGGVYAKLYVDIAVFYAYIMCLLVLGFAGTATPAVRRCMHRPIRMPRLHGSLRLPDWLWECGGSCPGTFCIGEALLVLVTTGLFIWWLWWWAAGFSYLAAQGTVTGDPHPLAQTVARVLGHMANLSLSLVLFPVARNSVWEAAFGLPFDRALYYHRAMGRIAWLFTTLHMLVWMGKWAAEGNLWRNVLATHDVVIGGPKP